MNENRITIPTIPYGLRSEETIIQIATALKSIDTITTDVFQQIEDNINSHRKYLSDLQKRSEIIASKVDQLAGRNIATTVYAHHKFPAEENNYDTLFRMNLKPPVNNDEVSITNKHQYSRNNKNSNVLKFYHLKSTNETFPKYQELVLEQGLGSIPADVEDVSSLLLFNTTENIYNNYVMRDPLFVDVDYSSPTTDENNPSTNIAAAPNSIVNNYMFQNTEYFDSFYTPAYQEVPTLNVPVDLPDLPGIADDIKFNMLPETSIAPSKQKIQNVSFEDPKIPDPKISIDSPDSRDIIPEPKIVESVTISTPSAPIKIEPSTINTQISPPPPPPPPPPPAPISAPPAAPPLPLNVDKTPAEPSAPKSSTPGVGNVHANLMEAIRNAGGKEKAKLRSISQNESEPIVAKQSGSKETDFMADLYAKLALRRKGISGQVKDNTKNSLLDRMSSLIPPSPPNDSESDDDVTNDWDD